MKPTETGAVEMIRSGATYEEIRAKFGISNQKIKALIGLHEIKRPKKKTKKDAIIAAIREDGTRTGADVARLVGCDPKYVYNVAFERGLNIGRGPASDTELKPEAPARKFRRREGVMVSPAWVDKDDTLFEAVENAGSVMAGVNRFADQHKMPSSMVMARWHKIGREVLV